MTQSIARMMGVMMLVIVDLWEMQNDADD